MPPAPPPMGPPLPSLPPAPTYGDDFECGLRRDVVELETVAWLQHKTRTPTDSSSVSSLDGIQVICHNSPPTERPRNLARAGGSSNGRAVQANRSARTPSTDPPTNITPGIRRQCMLCNQNFTSGNQLHRHLTSCRADRPAPQPAGPPDPHRKRKLPQVPTSPLTYDSPTAAPPSKIRRFTHHSPTFGAITATESGGTTFYDTKPPSHDPLLEHTTALRVGVTLRPPNPPPRRPPDPPPRPWPP